MKNILISATLMLATMTFAYGQESALQEEGLIKPGEMTAYNPEGRQIVHTSQIPATVLEAFASSEFQGMSVIEVYELTGEALDEIPTLSKSPKPEKLYELMVEDSSRSAILYFTEEGELYDSIEKV